jgi:hypothetical protein
MLEWMLKEEPGGHFSAFPTRYRNKTDTILTGTTRRGRGDVSQVGRTVGEEDRRENVEKKVNRVSSTNKRPRKLRPICSVSDGVLEGYPKWAVRRRRNGGERGERVRRKRTAITQPIGELGSRD